MEFIHQIMGMELWLRYRNSVSYLITKSFSLSICIDFHPIRNHSNYDMVKQGNRSYFHPYESKK